MSYDNKRLGLGAVFRAFGAALQWRLLLLWILGLLLPTLIVALPYSMALGAQLDLSVHAGELARTFSADAFNDLADVFNNNLALNGAMAASILVTLLLSPLLTGMTLTAIRSPRTLGLSELAQGGMAEYGRLFRMMLWSIVPFGIAIALGSVGFSAVADRTEKAITTDDVATIGNLAMFAMAVLFVFAHATVEAGRAQFAADANLRSAIRAWWRGFKLVLRRPFATLGFYLVVTAIGLVIAAVLGIWRIKMPHASGGGFLLAFVVTQLIVSVNAWTRSARLYALTSVVKAS